MLQIQPAVSTEVLNQVFKLTGNIDVKATEQLETFYVLPENGSVELNFASVQRVNSMGLALLLKLFEHWQKRNIRIYVKNTNRMTSMLFRMMKLTHFLADEPAPAPAPIVVPSPSEIETPVNSTSISAETTSSVPADPIETMYRQAKQYYDSNAYNEALPLFAELAEQGHVKARFYLGLMYTHGYAVEKNHTTAIEWLRKAAEQGHAGGQYNLGAMYGNGYGISKDYVAAAAWFHKAAAQGHAGGQASLGTMYEYGYGVEKNYATALLWYRMAAAQGHERAIRQLAAFLET